MSGINIAIFASGSGSNALQFMHYFEKSASIRIVLVLSNKKEAPVLEKAKTFGIACVTFSNEQCDQGTEIVACLKEYNVDWIVLAGFLRKISSPLLNAFPKRIINIHPSLLPDFGGKGMYGRFVHEAVIAAKATKSGITIHYVNDVFDEGEHIAQFELNVLPTDTAETLAHRIQGLEHTHFAPSVEKILLSHE